LPDTWPDRLDLRHPVNLWRFLRRVFGAPGRVEIPVDLPGRELLPKYILQEFHNLPNGNYSKKITQGYITGFDRVMLGHMRHARRHIAEYLRGCRSALDVGSAGGRLAGALKTAGVAEVWGLDPSPYLLQHAARANPGVNFVQGVAERTGFPDQRFDGVAACFLLHELPPRYIEQSLRELHRILKPGGLLAICEPSALNLRRDPRQWLRRGGLRKLYFYALARFVHEPFIDAWHSHDAVASLTKAGFEPVLDQQAVPLRFLFARKIG
jgi:ubiquinone/menaquinone biosynthesis C-methylase UbiE